jgi:hypothetical protein
MKDEMKDGVGQYDEALAAVDRCIWREKQRQQDALEIKYLRESIERHDAAGGEMRARLAQLTPSNECLLQIGETLFRPIGSWMQDRQGKDIMLGGIGPSGPLTEAFCGFTVRLRAHRRKSGAYVYGITDVEDGQRLAALRRAPPFVERCGNLR